MFSSASASDHDRLIQKLDSITLLCDADREALRSLPMTVRVIEANAEIVHDRDDVTRSCILLDGFASRYRDLVSGRRQIMSFHVAGDFLDLHSLYLGTMDHSIGTLAKSRLGFVPHSALLDITSRHPAIAAALWRDTMIDGAIFREWIVNVGRRDAYARIAHLLCELFVKAQAVGLTIGNSCKIPLTQADLADATGITVVHVNRTVKALRLDGLVSIAGRSLTIPNWEALRAAAGFDQAYLHLRKNEVANLGEPANRTQVNWERSSERFE